MLKQIESITIVGGDTSAWLSAAYLVSQCSLDVKITLIDKSDGSPIGVGEATLIPFISFLEKCGFSESMWFDEIDSTIKGGILFENWKEDGKNIWHPFSYTQYGEKYDSGITLWSNNQHLNFSEYALPDYDLYVENKKTNEKSAKSVARHIDCTKLSKFIKKYLIHHIFFINSAVDKIVRNENGDIDNLILENGQIIKSDLYIDCTGFKKILSQENKKVFLTDRLFCDTAIAGHVPYNDRKKEMHPYTACDAVEHGWIWKIPIRTRIGTGLVFNRSITDIEKAKEYFINYWDSRIEKESLKVIDWTPYYSEKFWSNNVISIGLSGGFIEPLESTGLHLIQTGLERLEKIFRNSFYTQEDVNLYNIKMKCLYEESVDFVSMHYCNSNKTGKFWDFVRSNTLNLNKRMEFYLNLMKLKNNYIDIRNIEDIFSHYDWILMLIQLGYSVNKFETSFGTYQSLEDLYYNYNKNMQIVQKSIDADVLCDMYMELI